MNSQSLYFRLYPVDLREVDVIASAFCCDKIKMTHSGCEGMVCVFCEDECPECETDLF